MDHVCVFDVQQMEDIWRQCRVVNVVCSMLFVDERERWRCTCAGAGRAIDDARVDASAELLQTTMLRDSACMADMAFAKCAWSRVQNGETEIGVYPSPTYNVIDPSDFTRQHALRRKICYRIGEMCGLPTRPIRVTLFAAMWCNDPFILPKKYRHIATGRCMCNLDGDFPRYYYGGILHRLRQYGHELYDDYDDRLTLSLYPHTVKAGVRFVRKGVREQHRVRDKLRQWRKYCTRDHECRFAVRKRV